MEVEISKRSTENMGWVFIVDGGRPAAVARP